MYVTTLKQPGVQMAGQMVDAHTVFLNLCEDILLHLLYLWIQKKHKTRCDQSEIC